MVRPSYNVGTRAVLLERRVYSHKEFLFTDTADRIAIECDFIHAHSRLHFLRAQVGFDSERWVLGCACISLCLCRSLILSRVDTRMMDRFICPLHLTDECCRSFPVVGLDRFVAHCARLAESFNVLGSVTTQVHLRSKCLIFILAQISKLMTWQHFVRCNKTERGSPYHRWPCGFKTTRNYSNFGLKNENW